MTLIRMVNSLLPMFDLPANVFNTLRHMVFTADNLQDLLFREFCNVLLSNGWTKGFDHAFKWENLTFREIPWLYEPFCLIVKSQNVMHWCMENYYDYLLILPFLFELFQAYLIDSCVWYEFDDPLPQVLRDFNWSESDSLYGVWKLGNYHVVLTDLRIDLHHINKLIISYRRCRGGVSVWKNFIEQLTTMYHNKVMIF